MEKKMKAFTRKELGQICGIPKLVSSMNKEEVKSAQIALALVRSKVDFASPEGKRLRCLAEDLRDRVIRINKNILRDENKFCGTPVPGRIWNSLEWKERACEA